MTARDAGRAGDQHQVTRIEIARRDFEVVLRLVRDVVRREVGGLAVFADVRAIETFCVAPATRRRGPPPSRRRHTVETEVTGVRAVEERGDGAADVARLFAIVDELARAADEQLCARGVVEL